ncbi:hypothetical protein AGMMS4956_09970 [Bacteroidia bacterium]|nr:hypothetical protein AGMMS4956_09970 [Bacteroidia bacterium]
MPEYRIHISTEAEMDMVDLYNHIAYVYMAISTAHKYFEGILDTIENLKIYGNSLAYSRHKSLIARYGNGVKVTHYKKMAIIFEIIDNVVYIYRVMAGALIQ